MYANEADYWEFVRSARTSIANLPLSDAPPLASSRVEVRGSLRRGQLKPPYSDIDLLVIAPRGAGRELRDALPGAVAMLGGGLLTLFVDPFSPEGTLCSIYPGPLKVDWFVSEEGGRAEGRNDVSELVSDAMIVTVWNGKKPPPYDWESHPWDWLWWLWCKTHSQKPELVSSELPKLWQFLRLHGVDVGSLPPTVPDPRDLDELRRLLLVTLDMLPTSNTRLAGEIRRAVETDPSTR